MRARSFVPLLALASLVPIVAPAFDPSASSPSASSPSPSPLPRAERGAQKLTGTVVRTVDGDTVHVRLADRVEKVRYIGIDTPEVHHPKRGEEPGGRAATEINRRLVGDRAVRLEPDVQLRDRHGRLLAYVWVKRADGVEVMVNAEMVRLGYAQVMTIPPNVRHAEMFRKLAAEARENHRGLWARPLGPLSGILSVP
jgi:micrococcal nuclease